MSRNPKATAKKAATPRKPRQKTPWAVLLVLGLAVCAGALFYSRPGNKSATTAASLPSLKLEGMDPAVSNAIYQAKAEIEKAPQSGAAWGRLGSVLAVHDYILESDGCFAQAEKLESKEVRWPYLRGLALSGENLDTALPCLERAARLNSDAPAPRLRYAEALIERGKLGEAEAQILQVYKKDDRDPRALLGLGRIALARGQVSESLKYLKLSSELAPYIRATHALLATVHQRLGNGTEAEQALKRASTLPETPEWSDPYLAEANALRKGKAAATLVADLLLQKGQASKAVEIMKPVTRQYPDFVKGWIMLGKACNELKDYTAAEKALRQAAQLEPNSVDVKNELGSALFGQSRYKEAETAYREALQIKSNQAEAWFNLGLALMNQKENEQAIESFQNAVRYKPDMTYAYLRWGQALGRLKRVPEAIQQMQQALRLDPENAEAKEMLNILQKFSPGTP